MIFKVQAPLAGDRSRALIHNRDRTIELHVPVEKVSKLLRGRSKVYASGSIMGRMVYFDRIVSERDW